MGLVWESLKVSQDFFESKAPSCIGSARLGTWSSAGKGPGTRGDHKTQSLLSAGVASSRGSFHILPKSTTSWRNPKIGLSGSSVASTDTRGREADVGVQSLQGRRRGKRDSPSTFAAMEGDMERLSLITLNEEELRICEVRLHLDTSFSVSPSCQPIPQTPRLPQAPSSKARAMLTRKLVPIAGDAHQEGEGGGLRRGPKTRQQE